jgi:hypothetical protein
MPDAENTVFISYRRDVSSYIARAIFLDLRGSDYDVFVDRLYLPPTSAARC